KASSTGCAGATRAAGARGGGSAGRARRGGGSARTAAELALGATTRVRAPHQRHSTSARGSSLPRDNSWPQPEQVIEIRPIAVILAEFVEHALPDPAIRRVLWWVFPLQ